MENEKLNKNADGNSVKADVSKSFFGDWTDVNDKLPDNLQYHLVAWELPSPDGKSMVTGTRSAMCEIYKDKKWYGENGIVVNGVTHWSEFPKSPKYVC